MRGGMWNIDRLDMARIQQRSFKVSLSIYWLFTWLRVKQDAVNVISIHVFPAISTCAASLIHENPKRAVAW